MSVILGRINKIQCYVFRINIRNLNLNLVNERIKMSLIMDKIIWETIASGDHSRSVELHCELL